MEEGYGEVCSYWDLSEDARRRAFEAYANGSESYYASDDECRRGLESAMSFLWSIGCQVLDWSFDRSSKFSLRASHSYESVSDRDFMDYIDFDVRKPDAASCRIQDRWLGGMLNEAACDGYYVGQQAADEWNSTTLPAIWGKIEDLNKRANDIVEDIPCHPGYAGADIATRKRLAADYLDGNGFRERVKAFEYYLADTIGAYERSLADAIRECADWVMSREYFEDYVADDHAYFADGSPCE